MTHTIYTDGSCLGNPGPGGWAFLVVDPAKKGEAAVIHTNAGSEEHTTNNRMEMTALIEALRYAKKQKCSEVRIFSDSQHLVNTLNLGWKRKANLDLWIELEKYMGFAKLKIDWVKAHHKSIFNNMVDELALKAAGGKRR